MCDKDKTVISEGRIERGGVSPKPATEKPVFNPPGQAVKIAPVSSLSHVSTAKHIQEFVNNAIKELDNILEEIAKVDPRYGMIIAK